MRRPVAVRFVTAPFWRDARHYQIVALTTLVIFNFDDRPVEHFHNIPYGVWRKRFDSTDKRWMGPGATAHDVIETPRGELTLQPHGVLLYEKQTGE